MNRVDRIAGVRLVTDHPLVTPAPPTSDIPEVEDTGERDDIVVLVEREDTFHRVELRWNRTTDVLAILVEDGTGTHGALIPKDKGNDAFVHPYLYLPR